MAGCPYHRLFLHFSMNFVLSELRGPQPTVYPAAVLVSHLQTPPRPDPGDRSELQNPVPAPAALVLTPISYKEKYPMGNRAPSRPDFSWAAQEPLTQLFIFETCQT